jgi:AcrR family transcriptional regulator
MSPRPRTVADGAILEATARAISRVGPGKVTLADIALEVGLSPATLVQRFGSKRGLLLALAESAAGSVEACFEAVRAAHGSPLEALLSAATEMARMTATPEEMANHLAFLQMDLQDVEFRRHMRDSSAQLVAGYRALLDEAVAEGELKPCDTAKLARAVGAMSGGSLIGWTVEARGTAEAWVREDLATLLEPYRTSAHRDSSGEGERAGSEVGGR